MFGVSFVLSCGSHLITNCSFVNFVESVLTEALVSVRYVRSLVKELVLIECLAKRVCRKLTTAAKLGIV